MSPTVSIPLTELLLRPSTLRRFTKRGFESTDEIEESRANGGINLLASELDVSLQEAAGLIREVQGCLEQNSRARRSATNANTNNDSSRVENAVTETNSEVDGHRQQQQLQLSPTRRNYNDGIVTAYELLRMNDSRRSSSNDGNNKKHHRRRHIVTFCRSIDDLIGGGIALGEVTEISGMPGTGKTQLATQLSILARLPHIYGGVEGRTLYVDAEGSFLAERAHSMAESLFNHVKGRAQYQQQRQRQHSKNIKNHDVRETETPSDNADSFTTEGILDSIDVFRVHDEAALLATLYSLKHYIESSIEQEPSSSSILPVKLIIVDSIAFHFRAVVPIDSSYYVQRTKTLTALAAYLGDLARQHDLAVVVINQMTTKIGVRSSNGNTTSVVPALGESWAHATATRLLLSKEERVHGDGYDQNNGSDDDDDDDEMRLLRRGVPSQLRTCSLIKSAHKPTGKANYRILEEGIRDVSGEREGSRCDSGNNKRSRLS